MRTLLRNRVALAFGALFVAIVLLCLLAPVYAKDVAHTGPNDNHITETVNVGGKQVDVVSPTGVPIGPTWKGRFFLGADSNGRDVAVRLLYGGRNSLEIAGDRDADHDAAGGRAGHACRLYARHLRRGALAPVRPRLGLPGRAARCGARRGAGRRRDRPRPVHFAQRLAAVAGVRDRDRLLSLRGQAACARRHCRCASASSSTPRACKASARCASCSSEILPNLASSIVVFVPLIIANAILLEAGLSYLGAGVQDPNPSWGTMLADGIRLIPGAIHLVLVPGIMLV